MNEPFGARDGTESVLTTADASTAQLATMKLIFRMQRDAAKQESEFCGGEFAALIPAEPLGSSEEEPCAT